MIKELAMVATGGALGASARYLISRATIALTGHMSIYATLIANVVGCFLLGMVYVLLVSKFNHNENIRLLFVVGFLGALTTWSTFSMETVLMFQAGDWLKAMTYTVITTVFCFTAFWLGVKI